MKNDVDMEELKAMIPSATVREYVLESGWSFTDREKAGLLLHNDLPLNEQFCRLRSLRDNTDDNVLKEKITRYLNSEEQGLRELKENSDRYYIYVLKVCDSADRDYYAVGYFIDYEAAYEYGIKDHEIYSFEIEKYLVHGARSPERYDEEWSKDHAVSFLRFKKGEAYYFDNEHSEYDFKYFDYYFRIPNPFERGDIVKVINTDLYGVVETSQKTWAEDVERRLLRNSIDQIGYDFTDNVIAISVPDEDGLFSDYDHSFPENLELYQPKPSHEGGTALDDLLLEVSKIYKGDGYLSNMWFLAKEYRKAKDRENKNVSGM